MSFVDFSIERTSAPPFGAASQVNAQLTGIVAMAVTSQQRLAQQYARDWWAAYPDRHSAICDRCNSEINRNEGCLIEGYGLDLICDGCFDEHTPGNYHAYRARLDAMKAKHENKSKSTPLEIAGTLVLTIVFWTAVIWGAFYFFG